MGQEQSTQNLNPLPSLSDRCCVCGYGLRRIEKGVKNPGCQRCYDVWKRKQNLTADQAEEKILKQVGNLYLEATLDDLDDAIHQQLLNLSYGKDVFMFGPVGTGKTYAMAALLRHYIYEGFYCLRINFDDFCVELRSTMSSASEKAEYKLIESLKQADKLFIDDLGLRSGQESNFVYVTLFSILNGRQERLLPTFFSSNKSIEQIGQQYDSRIASRLRTALIIEMIGADRRMR